jgi:hypothetical protein
MAVMAADRASERHGVGLADGQLASAGWSTLGSAGGSAEHVRTWLATMLFSEDAAAVNEAYGRIENPVTAQGDLSECAPAVVSVIMAALAEDSIFLPNLGSVLDLLGLILAGTTARWLVATGGGGLRTACYAEAMKGYWSLKKVTLLAEDPYDNAGLATELVEMLDEEAVSPQRD